MLSTKDIYNRRVHKLNKKGCAKRYGRIRAVVFHPHKPAVVGFVVKRPDLALMIKRKNRFVAFDRIVHSDVGLQIIDQPDTWDEQACKRLGIDYEQCILWDNMPVKNEAGLELGKISNVFFDDKHFYIDHIDLSANSAQRKLLGAANIDKKDILGYHGGAIIVAGEIEDIEHEGGAAARAGQAWANVKHKGTLAGMEFGEKASVAAGKGAYKLGESIGELKNAFGEAGENYRAELGNTTIKPNETTDEQTASYKVGESLGALRDAFVKAGENLTIEASNSYEAQGAQVVDAQVGSVPAALDSGPIGQATASGMATKPTADAATKPTAGESAKAVRARQAAKKPEPVNKEPDDFASKLGRQLGKASHMFQDFKTEYDKASKGE